MKKGLFTLLLLIITALPALAAPTNTSGPWGIDAGGFKNLSTALASPSTIGKTVVVTKPMAINNKTLPTNRSLKIIYGGRIDPATGKTFDFNKQNPEAGDYQIIGGAGSVKGWTDVPVPWVGAISDDALDDARTIQKAIDSVYVSGGGVVRLRTGTYLLSSMQQPSGGAAYTVPWILLEAKDKVSVIGAGPSTILKAANGMRTTNGGMAILYNQYQLISDLTISDLTVDGNGQNNLILAGYSNSANTERMGGEIARNVTVARVHFKNIAGHHGVWFGATPLDSRNGSNKMLDCTVETVCDDIVGNTSTDFSGIYSYGDNTEVRGNTFKNTAQSFKATAIEVGGNNVTVTANRVEKFSTAVNAVAAFASTYGLDITGNTFKSVNNGVYIWAINAVVPTDPGYVLMGLNISGNSMYINDPSAQSGAAASYGIIFGNGTDMTTVNPYDWVIADNTITMMLNAPSAYAFLNTGISLRPVTNLTITGNAITWFKGPGIQLANMDGLVRSFSNVILANNPIRSCGYTDGDVTRRAGIYIGNNPNVASNDLQISNNIVSGGAVGTAVVMDYGIYFNYGGVPQYTNIKGNIIIAASIFDIYATNFVATPYYFHIDHVAQKAGSPRSYRVAATVGSRWIDSTTNYIYNTRDVLSGTTSLGVTPWLADISVSGSPQSTAPYSTATWQKGSRATPVGGYVAVGSPKAWTCTVSGTGGTLAGVTGSITTGTTALVVNTAAGLSIGNYITIAGVTGVKQIVTISGTTVTLDTTASATVAGAAVAYQPHTWVSEGIL